MTPIADRLPEDTEPRRRLLDAYFPRRLAEAERRADGRWDITLRPFDEDEMHVDPRLREGLDWWESGLDLTGIATAVRREGTSQLSLEDSWTALAWSHWLAGAGGDPMTILHVDDHDDLMAPLLARDGENGWEDLVTNDPVDLQDPPSVHDAIVSGAIGVAGFFTPFVHEVPSGEVRHLCASAYAETRRGRFRLIPQTQDDDLLRPGAQRPGARLAPAADFPAVGWSYSATSSCEQWLSDLPDGPLLLHVDFDYFCNRFNGDSDWSSAPARNDASEDEVLARVDAIAAAIADASVGHRVAAVSGALSPGFFPAEMWAATVSRLAVGLSQSGVGVPAWRH